MGSKIGGTLFALVFLLSFGGIGLGAGWGIVSMFRDSLRAGDWVLVQAKVDDAALKASRGSKGGSTYSADGAYRYTVGGRQYVSTKLGFDFLGGSDNIGDWQQSMAEFLEQAKKSGKTIPVYVNPDNPAEAVVDRDVRWAMVLFMGIFAVVFGGVGVGALVAIGFIWFKKDQGSKRGRQGRQAAPVASASSGIWVLWVFAFFWNAISFPAAILIIPDVLETGQWAGLLILIFPFVGLFVLWGAISATWNLLRRGKPAITLEPPQPRAGARFSGVARYSRGVKPGDVFTVRLACLFAQRHDDPSPVPRWSKDLLVRAVADPAGGARLPFQFDPPARVKGVPPNSVRATWKLVVEPKAGGFGASEEFPVALQPALEVTEDTPPALPTPEEQRYQATLAKMLGPAQAARLTPEQRASFAELPPDAQAMAAKVVANAGLIRKVVIGIVVLFFAFQIIGILTAILR
jgi:hypothetical protein